MPELDLGEFFAIPPYILGYQNTPYILGLNCNILPSLHCNLGDESRVNVRLNHSAEKKF